MQTDEMIIKFENAYSSGDIVCDSMSMARREDGEYEQSLARLCYKWFCKGINAAGEPPASEQLNAATETCSGIPQFIEMVIDMRAAQKEYFKTRDMQWLNKSKQLERGIDNWIKNHKQGVLI